MRSARAARPLSGARSGSGAPVAPRGERKLVSILFVDLAGYTALSAALDPEEVYRFLRPGLLALQSIVEDFGGNVPQILGDGFMAVFGVPTTHEDDAERAVRAALAVRAHVAELNAGRRGIRFPDVHAGVNSGEVMVAPSDEPSGFAVIGDTVNTASRLGDLAPAGRILVDERTRQRTAHAVRYGRRRERRAKGKPAPIVTFDALDVVAAPPTPRAGGTFVDRADVLERIRAEVRAVRDTASSRVLVVTGEPGVGKSRLAAELRRRRVGAVAVGRGSAFGGHLPLRPVAEALRSALHLRERATSREVDAAAAALGRSLPRADAMGLGHYLRALLGVERLPSGEARGSLTDAARGARLAIAALAGSSPLVVVLDDLQWADEGTIEFLGDAHRHPIPGAALFLGLARQAPPLRGLRRLDLEPLPDGDMRALATALAGAGLSERVLEMTLERAAGNPLFLEETLGMLAEVGGGAGGPGGAAVDAEALRAVPSKIRLLIAARLDGLPPEEKRVLQVAAVAGDAATEDLLAALGEPGDGDVRRAIRSLERRGLLVRRSAERLDVKHVLIRDVAYESLPRAERAARHAQIAERIRATSPGADGAAAAALAHHAERAWDLGRSRTGPPPDPEIAVGAVAALEGWAERAFGYQARLAESVYSRAIAVTRAAGDAVEPATRARLLAGRAESLIEMGRHADAEADATEALEVAEALGDRRLAARALLALGRSLNDLGQTRRARTLLARARRLCRQEGDRRGEAWSLHRLSETWSGIDYRREVEGLRGAYELFATSRDRWGTSIAAQDLAYLLSTQGGPEFLTWYRRSRRLVEDEGDVRSRATLARTSGYFAFYRGCDVEAVRAMEQARPLAAECGDRYAEADAVLIRAQAQSSSASPGEAEAALDELLALAEELRSGRLRVLALLARARVALRSGRPGDSSRSMTAALALIGSRGMSVWSTEANATRAVLALEGGALGAVAPAATQLAASVRRSGWDLWRPLGPLLRGRALLGRGRIVAAERELGRAEALAREVGADGTERLAALARGQASMLSGGDARRVRPLDGVPEHEALAHELRGLRALRRGQAEAARDAFGAAVERWRALGTTGWLARALALEAHAARLAGAAGAARASDHEARGVLASIRTPSAERPFLLEPAVPA